MRRFVGVDLGREPVPDETTVCRFRHLLEEHELGRQLFDEAQLHLAAKGLKVATGTIINAPSSAKNAKKARDPEILMRPPAFSAACRSDVPLARGEKNLTCTAQAAFWSANKLSGGSALSGVNRGSKRNRVPQ